MGKKDKQEQKNKLRGKEGFDSFYSEIFKERWETLRQSLFNETVYAEWKVQDKEAYYLDPASVMAAMQLPLDSAENLLDMCAAPGGKTLVIASRMESSATLVSNEKSAQRKLRLSNVCDSSLPEEVRNRIKISCSDAARWCTTQTECYDRILLDAPCSSERHVLQDEKYLNEWSPARIKTLSMEQWALLSSAYRLLSPGGYILYSTCALCPQENDEVVRRLFKKFDDCELVYSDLSVVPYWDLKAEHFCKTPVIPVPEKTELGYHILPDQKEGCGPIWFTLIHKKGN